MFTVTIETTFTAEHQLTVSDGNREPLHSHDWIVRTAVSTAKLDQTGLAIDFNELKADLERITAPFDGARLEELSSFENINASAENVAKYIYNEIEPILPSQVELQYVEVMESPNCWAKYSV